MRWRIAFKPSAAKAFEKLDPTVQRHIQAALDLPVSEMTEQQRPVRSDVAKLKGRAGEFRLKVPGWRVIFRFEHDRQVILVLEIGNRGEIY